MAKQQTKLSDFELEVMQLLWQQDQASAPELHQGIQGDRQVSYSTVKTIIDRLEEKGAIERAGQQGRTIFYRTLLSQDQISRPLVKSFIKRVFGGKPRSLFSHLLEDAPLDQEDIAYLEDLIAKKKQQLKDKQ